MFLALVKKELLTLSRDIHGLGALFFMPVVFIVVMSMVLKDIYSPPVKSLTYAIADHDGGQPARQLAQLWAQQRGVALPLPDRWQEAVRAGQLKYVLLLEPGFSSAVVASSSVAGITARLMTDPGLDYGAFESNRAQLSALVTQLRTEAMLAKLPMLMPNNKQLDSKQLDGSALVSAERITLGLRPTAVQQNVPAWLVFGMFFVVTSIAGLFIEERSCGALVRLRSLGVSPVALLAAKTLAYMGVNGVQAVLMLAVGVWLMPLIGGDGLSLAGIHWGALLLMLLAISAAAVGLALTIACAVKTHAQASALGPILNVLMASIGGVMVPQFVMPPVMQRLATWSPMNWGLEGLLDVLLRSGNISSVLPQAYKLIAFAALMLAIAYLLFRRRGAA